MAFFIFALLLRSEALLPEARIIRDLGGHSNSSGEGELGLSLVSRIAHCVSQGLSWPATGASASLFGFELGLFFRGLKGP